MSELRKVRIHSAHKKSPARFVGDDPYHGIECLVFLDYLKDAPLAVERMTPKRALEVADELSLAARIALNAGVPFDEEV